MDHCALVGRKAELDFNVPLFEAFDELGVLQTMTARSNGRCFGYLVSILSPSLDGLGYPRGAPHGVLLLRCVDWVCDC